ncbi:MAG: ATP-binding cassette domain-containing protein [Chloroflexi bacterium]|nr:ATP-binding cassette domain-containing protein [Chloroflexota bacterium]
MQSSEAAPDVPEGAMLGAAARPAILVEGLRYRYPSGDDDVLHGLSLEIAPGEFVGITGPSGAGKTTLCLCLKGLIPFALGGRMQGRVEIEGVSTRDIGPGKLAETAGLVFQDPESQIIGLTVEEDLAFGPENFAMAPAEIRSRIPLALQTVGLAGLQERETHSLSGGQKQRTAIASALMMEPAILILDEPTSELDPIGRQEVFQTVKRLREERRATIVMVEHDMEELAEVADRIIIMDHGTIIADAPPHELFHDAALFESHQGVRMPQAAEVLNRLRADGLIPADAVSPYESEAIEVLSHLLAAATLPRVN